MGDLARLHGGFARCRESLNLEAGWSDRWSATWRFGRTPVACSVRNMGEVEVARSRPVRRFTWRTGQWHRPGLEYLVSTDRHHGFESFEEEQLLLVSDFAADLVEALAQPFRLRFLTSGGAGEHTPDFLLLTESAPWLVDVRPAGRVRPEDQVRFAASAEAALAVGWNYSVVTGWREHVVTTVDTLCAGRRALSDPLGLHDQLLAAAEAGPLPFGDLVEQCSVPAVARAHAVHLLWRRRLGVDMTAPFADASLVRLAAETRGIGGAR
ncbi:TnsA-like heteromeric transposase endonuclease subunit [Streptomyces sp. 35M1]|uniref:TnsA-like heteromeric transposase endonuclease subunit n=1 Tax=Streptomyces sp. 35M1 TaxID=3142978 RepID=UPI0039904DF7